jgi:hypothetical protein
MIRELTTKIEFRDAVTSGSAIVITDKGGPARFHPSAQSCDHITFEAFFEKVLTNKGRNGRYFAVSSKSAALERWPSLSDCFVWT